MPLTEQQVGEIRNVKYIFPSLVWDNGKARELDGIQAVETHIGGLLKGEKFDDIREGLISVVCWGWGNTPLVDTRVKKAANLITGDHVAAFKRYREEFSKGNILALSKLKIPQLGYMAFGTKVLAFMRPETRTVLDKKIVSLLRSTNFVEKFCDFPNPNSIRITEKSAGQYDHWCECCCIGARQVGNGFRAVDFERAAFSLINTNNQSLAIAWINNILMERPWTS